MAVSTKKKHKKFSVKQFEKNWQVSKNVKINLYFVWLKCTGKMVVNHMCPLSTKVLWISED